MARADGKKRNWSSDPGCKAANYPRSRRRANEKTRAMLKNNTGFDANRPAGPTGGL